MKRKIIVFAMLVATTFFWMPADSNPVSAQNKSQKGQNQGNARRTQPGKRGSDWNRGKKKSSHGYKNYGQYRRTQVGNRRYRLTRRYYWRDGVRLSRYVRTYY